MKKQTLSLLCLSAAAAGISLSSAVPAGADATGSVLHAIPRYSATSGLTEVSPGLFYGSAGTQIYSITPDGTYNVVTQFPNADGVPNSDLVVGNTGTYIYGTTRNPGASTGNDVFKMTLSGTVTVLKDLSGPSGLEPTSVIQGQNGLVYGTAAPAGSGSAQSGTFYSVTTGGAYKLLHTFPTGYVPSPLVQASDGNFYGSDYVANDQDESNGNIIKLTPGGAETNLKTYVAPYGLTLNEDASAAFAECNISTYGVGYVRVDPPNEVTVLSSGAAIPYGRLVLGPDGNFYGVTQRYSDGSSDNALIFRVTPDGVRQNIYDAASLTGGTYIYGICFGSDGNIYGVGVKAIFSVDISSPPVDPVISSISPKRVTVGGPAFTLTVTGTGFQSSTQLVVETVGPHNSPTYYNLTSTSQTSTSITATVPAAAIAKKFKCYVYAIDTTTSDQSNQVPLVIASAS